MTQPGVAQQICRASYYRGRMHGFACCVTGSKKRKCAETFNAVTALAGPHLQAYLFSSTGDRRVKPVLTSLQNTLHESLTNNINCNQTFKPTVDFSWELKVNY
jgi:hypothetical protein